MVLVKLADGLAGSPPSAVLLKKFCQHESRIKDSAWLQAGCAHEAAILGGVKTGSCPDWYRSSIMNTKRIMRFSDSPNRFFQNLQTIGAPVSDIFAVRDHISDWDHLYDRIASAAARAVFPKHLPENSPVNSPFC